MQELLDVVYHASFLTEEKRRMWFRVVFISIEKLEKQFVHDVERTRIIKLEKPRSFNVSELMKIAPAADPTQVLIGVSEEEKTKKLEIWGLVDAGTSWWDFERHETGGGRPPPNAFTLSSRNPGQISISRQGFILLVLSQGRIVKPSSNILYYGPVADFLEKGQSEIYQEVIKRIKSPKYDMEGHDDDYPKRFYVFFLERVLNRIKEKHHGGTVLIIPDELGADDTRLQDRLVIKYPCHFDASEPLIRELEVHRKYYDLHFKLWDMSQITKDEFKKEILYQHDLEEAKQNVKHAANFLSSLSAVDGAIVITERLRLLGFGAEIVAMSPNLKSVKVITDYESKKGEFRNIELFGTRHRSAFRFCSSFESSCAIIVSQDGEIRVCKRVGADVLLWPSISVATLGL